MNQPNSNVSELAELAARFAAAIASMGYRISDLFPVPEQVNSLSVTNAEGMELPLPPQHFESEAGTGGAPGRERVVW